jgi:two-component system, OmpR family, sensor histidine kinase KdpD
MWAAQAIMMQTSDTALERNFSPEMPYRAGRRKRRGRLKIFLGAAPGVGTTCEMIRAGITKHRESVDVVVGVVETHGRKEVETLLKELELVPSYGAAFNCRRVGEMDLDAVLARRPKLVLVDELAHVNASGARHSRRFKDVRELLRAGIDVYTTLNMQQVESLNNIVAKITRIRKGETVPDSVVNQADEIEVIDAAPWDIMQHLRRGKLSIWFAAS